MGILDWFSQSDDFEPYEAQGVPYREPSLEEKLSRMAPQAGMSNRPSTLGENARGFLESANLDSLFSSGVANRLEGYGQSVTDFLAPQGFQNANKIHQGYAPTGEDVAWSALEATPVGMLAGKLAMAAAPASSKVANILKALKKRPPKNMQEVPDFRVLDKETSMRLAENNVHLIPSGAASEGYHLGGPRNFKSMGDLIAHRADQDYRLAHMQPEKSWDWYKRINKGISRVTGDDPWDSLWMANQHGQYSAGRAPSFEGNAALLENNSAIMRGADRAVKPGSPAQQAASRRSMMNNDPFGYQLGPKTGEYGTLLNPWRGGRLPQSTGVNDFRYARWMGQTEKNGLPQSGALSSAQHRYMDGETAAAISRANKAKLGGHDNWTGEELQAVPWVQQKADDYFEKQRKSYMQRARDTLGDNAAANMPEDEIEKIARQISFEDANRTAADFFDVQTASATYEAQPGTGLGHLPGGDTASEASRAAYASDPLSAWDIAPGGRDGMYAGLRLGKTGVAGRVQPTQPMTGQFTPASTGILEENPGNIARPMVSWVHDPKHGRSVDPSSRQMLDTGEQLRGYLDAQHGGAWNKVYTGQPVGKSPDVAITKMNPGKASTEELARINKIADKYNMDWTSDTHQGIVIKAKPLEEGQKAMTKKEREAMLKEFNNAGAYKESEMARVDSDFRETFFTEEGSGSATRAMLGQMDSLEDAGRSAFNANPHIPQAATMRHERDALKQDWGPVRQDIQNARKIVGEGPGWEDRLRKALAAGVVLPAAAMVILQEDQQSGLLGRHPREERDGLL